MPITDRDAKILQALSRSGREEMADRLYEALEQGGTLPPTVTPEWVASLPPPPQAPAAAAPPATATRPPIPRAAETDARLRLGGPQREAREREAARLSLDAGMPRDEAERRAAEAVRSAAPTPWIATGSRESVAAKSGPAAVLEALRPQRIAGGADQDAQVMQLLGAVPGSLTPAEGRRVIEALPTVQPLPPEARAEVYRTWLRAHHPDEARREYAKSQGEMPVGRRILAEALTETDPTTGEVRESYPLAAMRGLGSAWAALDVPLIQALTYDVDEEGNPLDTEDWAYRASRFLRDAESQIRQGRTDTTSIIPRPLQGTTRTATDPLLSTGSYWQDVAQQVASGRMLGDELMDLPEYKDALGGGTAPWWIGLAAEVARPIGPIPAGGALKAAARAGRVRAVRGALEGLVEPAVMARLASSARDGSDLAQAVEGQAAIRIAADVAQGRPLPPDAPRALRQVYEEVRVARDLGQTRSLEAVAGSSIRRLGAEAAPYEYAKVGTPGSISGKRIVPLRDGRPVADDLLRRTGVEAPLTSPLTRVAGVAPAVRWQAVRDALDAGPVALSRAVRTVQERLVAPRVERGASPTRLVGLVTEAREAASQALRGVVADLKPGGGRAASAPERLDKILKWQGLTVRDLTRAWGEARFDVEAVLRDVLDEPLSVASARAAVATIVQRSPGAMRYAAHDGHVAPLLIDIAARSRAREALDTALYWGTKEAGILEALPVQVAQVLEAWAPSDVEAVLRAIMEEKIQYRDLGGGVVAGLQEIVDRGMARTAEQRADALAATMGLEAVLRERLILQGLVMPEDLARALPQLANRVRRVPAPPYGPIPDDDVYRPAHDLALIGADLAREIEEALEAVSTPARAQRLADLLPEDQRVAGLALQAVADTLSTLRRTMIQGTLGGLILPNTRYLAVNALTAPLIVGLSMGLREGIPAALNTRWRLARPDAVVAPHPALKLGPVDLAAGGITREMVEDMMAQMDLGKGKLDFEMTQDDLFEALRASQLGKAAEEVGGARTLARWLIPWRRNVWSVLSDQSDRFFRENVFVHEIQKGRPPEQAAQTARAAMLDYSQVSKLERDLLGQVVLFWAFQRQMALSMLKASVNRPSDVARLARLHYAAATQHDDQVLPSYGLTRLPALTRERRVNPDGSVVVDLGLSDPAAEAPLGVMADVWSIVSGLATGELTTTQEGVEGMLYTPEIRLLEEVRRGRGQEVQEIRFPGQWVRGLRALGVWQQAEARYDLAPLPARLVREGPWDTTDVGEAGQEIQWGFRSREGYERWVRDYYLGSRLGVTRTLEDYAKTGIIGQERGFLPAMSFAAGTSTPVTAATPERLLLLEQQRILREIKSLAERESARGDR